MNVFSGNLTVNLIGIVVAVAIITVTFFRWRFSYWKTKGLAHLKPTIIFGDAKALLTRSLSLGEQFQVFYKTFKSRGESHGGIFVGPKPTYVPTDPEIVKRIMQTDFSHFVNHGSFIDEQNDPLTGHLFSLEGAKWKNMRTKLTPTFTSGKMKMMFQTLVDCSVGLEDVVDQFADKNISVDIKDILGRFTTDVIASVGFGIECNCLKNPDEEFRKYGKRIVETTNWERFKFMLQLALPHQILRFLRIKLVDRDVEKFFMKTVKTTVDYREKNNVYRRDFMHLLLQLKNRGTIADDDKITDNGRFGEKALTINQVAAQAFLFFAAGFDTSSSAMTFALLELAIQQDLQDKVRQEINEVLQKHENQLTYEGVKEMQLLERVLKETLRKYPPLATLPRQCTKDYTIHNVRLEKGTSVIIPVLGIHRDPEFYPDPDKFDPERFLDENKRNRPDFAWIPFGGGPRACIGLRLGMMQSKIGLATVLKNYKVTLSEKTRLPIELEKNNFIISVEGGVWLKVEKFK